MENSTGRDKKGLEARLKADRDAVERGGGEVGKQGGGESKQSASACFPVSPLPRSPATLIAVTKTHPLAVIEEAIRLGITDFGENKVQEAAAKYPAIKAKYPHIKLHLIGGLQSNKVKEALALFDVIHTIDRPKLVDAVVKEVVRGGWCVVLKEKDAPENSQTATPHIPRTTHHAPRVFLIQVNTGQEAQKGGVSPAELPALLAYCKAAGLPISGLMCIPPANEPPAPHFALLQKLAAKHGLKELSMGMSGDYKIALRFGASMIRLGTALFGEREA
ncbi:MAG: YggS family pyridoxal phosphate enzyme [Alphaproteobacteria bacterium]